MREVLHIFKKDVRRHWPEILISLALLGTYTWRALRPAETLVMAPSFLGFLVRGAYLLPSLMIFWCFLIVRLVHGEPLVGNRQWWITKPYEWWKLLNAKVLFVVTFVGLPLFFSQLFLLHENGFPLPRNLGGVLGMDFALATVLILPCVAIGSMTKGLGQAVLVALALLFALGGTFGLIANVPSGQMASAASAAETTQGFLLIVSFLCVALCQYIRRKTWLSISILVSSFIVIMLIGVLTPYEKYVAAKYELVSGDQVPVRIRLGPLLVGKAKHRALPDSQSELFLHIPIEYSGVPSGKVVLVDGTKLSSDAAGWNPGWKQNWIELWTGSWQRELWYEVKRRDFERLKTRVLPLRLEVALTEYQEQDAKELVLQEGKFPAGGLGTCQLVPDSLFQLECFRPFHEPGVIATFNPQEANCSADETETSLAEDEVSHAWLAPTGEDSFDPGVNPVAKYSISFRPRLSEEEGLGRKTYQVRLCPGAKLNFAKPHSLRTVRVKLDMTALRLLDLID